MSVRAFEAGMRHFDGWAVVNLGGQDGCVLGISLVLLWLSGILIMGRLCGVLIMGLSGILVNSWLSDVLLDWLTDDGLSDDGLSDFMNSLGQDWSSIAVHGWLRNIGGLCVGDCLVPVVDHASVVFADGRVGCVNGFGDVADCSVVRSHDVLFRRSVLVVTIDGGGIDLMFWLVVVALDVLGLIAVHCWLSDVGLLLRERDLREGR